MEENLADALLQIADVIRWFRNYRMSNALVLCSRLLRAHNVASLEDLEKLVARVEEHAAPS